MTSAHPDPDATPAATATTARGLDPVDASGPGGPRGRAGAPGPPGAPGGPRRRQCAGTNRAGKPCGRSPIVGGNVCDFHGGKAPQVKRAAEKRLESARVEALAVTYGLPVRISAPDALLGELWRTQGIVSWLEAQVRLLAPDALTWGTTEIRTVEASQFGGVDTTEAHRIHVLIDLYARERTHLAKVARDCVSVGVDLALTERMRSMAGEMVTRITAVVRALGHNPGDPGVLRIVSQALATTPEAIEA